MTSSPSPQRKAETLRELHRSSKLLVLTNVWNPIGARLLEARGHRVIATASAAISSSLGYEDGERIRLTTLLDVLRRIVAVTTLPVTADIEGGYGESLDALGDTIDRVLDCGIVGINLEDGRDDGTALRDIDDQSERIAKARAVADEKGVALVINARIDCLLNPETDRESALEETFRRARAYFDAGADGVYPIGPADTPTVGRLRDGIDGPINILGQPGGTPLRELEAMGVNRVSFGPFLFRSALRHFAEVADELVALGSYDVLADMFSRADLRPLLRDRPE